MKHSKRLRARVARALPVILARGGLPAGGLVQPAQAKPYLFKYAAGPFTITVPDSRKLKSVEDGVELRGLGETIMMSVQKTTEKTIEPMLDEYREYYAKQGATFAGPSQQKAADGDVNRILAEIVAP
ncbi:MAG: hypothetical protein U1E62_09705 [Alsobacter sp.]